MACQPQLRHTRVVDLQFNQQIPVKLCYLQHRRVI